MVSKLNLKFVILIFHLIIAFNALTQNISYFNIVPFIGGVNNQAQALIVLPDSNEYYIMGDLIDSSNAGGQFIVRPYLSRFDYSGNLISTHIISDSLNIEKFHIDTRPIIKDSSSILVIIDRENSHFGYDPCLLRLDIESGKILQSKVFGFAPTADSSHIGEWYYKNHDDQVITFHYLLKEKRIYIRKIDNDFSVINEFLVEDNGRWNAPKYIEADSDSTFVLVGTSVAPPGGQFPESKVFYMRVNTAGHILDFKLVPNLEYRTVSFTSANSYTVLRDYKGNWYASVGIVNIINMTPLSYAIVPIAISLTPDFDSLRWINYFSNIPLDTFQFYNLTATAWGNDKSGFVISGYDFSLSDRNSFITKIDTNRNIVWTRSFIPLGWENDDFAWADLEDIKSTPFNTFVASGMIYDNNNMIRQPWIIHIDSMGCLIPGCDVMSSNETINLSDADRFNIYPNPAGDQIYLEFKGINLGNIEYMISLLDSSSKFIKSSIVNPNKEVQYILDLSEIPSGIYFIEIRDKNNNYIQTEKIIKL